MIRKLLLGLFIFQIGNAFAIVDGNTLIKSCNIAIKVFNDGERTSGAQWVESSYCLGFVAAAADGFILTKDICVSKYSTYEQYTRVTTKYLNDNPKYLDVPATLLVYSALKQAYPCEK